MPHPLPHFTPAQIIAAIRKTSGLQYLAARELDCSTRTLERYIKKYKEIADVVRELKGQRVDFTEGKLWEAIQRGEAWAIIFFLKTQAKDRGYTERIEHTGRDGLPLLTVRYVNDWRKVPPLKEPHAGHPPALPAPGPTNGAPSGESL